MSVDVEEGDKERRGNGLFTPRPAQACDSTRGCRFPTRAASAREGSEPCSLNPPRQGSDPVARPRSGTARSVPVGSAFGPGARRPPPFVRGTASADPRRRRSAAAAAGQMFRSGRVVTYAPVRRPPGQWRPEAAASRTSISRMRVPGVSGAGTRRYSPSAARVRHDQASRVFMASYGSRTTSTRGVRVRRWWYQGATVVVPVGGAFAPGLEDAAVAPAWSGPASGGHSRAGRSSSTGPRSARDRSGRQAMPERREGDQYAHEPHPARSAPPGVHPAHSRPSRRWCRGVPARSRGTARPVVPGT